MAFPVIQQTQAVVSGGSSWGGTLATANHVFSQAAAAGNLLLLVSNAEDSTGTYPHFATAIGWNGVDGATTGVDTNNAHQWVWLWRVATGGETNVVLQYTTDNSGNNHIQQFLEVQGPNTIVAGATVASYPSSGHGTEPSPAFTATNAFFHSWGYRTASFAYWVSPAQWNSYSAADNVPAQSLGMAWYDESGTDGNGTGTTIQATWSKSNSFYFDIGIVAFVQSGGGGIRNRDSGINRGIARGIF